MMPPIKIGFICTHNSCRSIIAEAIARQLSGGRLLVASGGSHPSGRINPQALSLLIDNALPVNDLKSQSWNELEPFKPDVLITVCDQAAEEICPISLDQAIRVHWGVADPSAYSGSEKQIAAAFEATYHIFHTRISRLLELPIEQLSATQLQQSLSALA